ncbi:unnamed protein product, partial [Brassica oleracea var. botrytis]
LLSLAKYLLVNRFSPSSVFFISFSSKIIQCRVVDNKAQLSFNLMDAAPPSSLVSKARTAFNSAAAKASASSLISNPIQRRRRSSSNQPGMIMTLR